jgi:hypothetical protein
VTAKIILLAAIAAVAIGVVGAGAPRPASEQRTFFVDYDRGSDGNSGTSPGQPWRHAPGDPQAAGRPKSTLLRAGDRVVFASGVAYRGEIKIAASGTPGRPIIFESAPGDMAVLDGSDPVTVTPCRNADECGGHSDWRGLVLIKNAAPLVQGTALFLAKGGQMRLAQAPDPKNAFYAEEPDDMLAADASRLQRGEIHLSGNIPTPQVGDQVAIWVKSNTIVYRPVVKVVGRTAYFRESGLNLYTDRPGKVAFVGGISALDEDGEYVILPNGSAVAKLPQHATTVTAGTGRGGFELQGASYVTIRRLLFRNMSDQNRLFGGVAILSNRRGSQHIEIIGNRFSDMHMPLGQGAVTLRWASQIKVSNNQIERIRGGSGIRITGPATGIEIRDNQVRQVGRTGIMLMGVSEAEVRANLVSDVRGVHGNGLSAYMDSRNVRFIGNTVVDAKQPATFKTNRGTSGASGDIVFANNLLIATPGSLGSLISWGTHGASVRLANNVLVGGRFGVRLNRQDSDVR